MDQQILDFLNSHTNADLITVDSASGIPISAHYSTLDGIPRQFPATFYFEDLLK
jgi:hypothetical protein